MKRENTFFILRIKSSLMTVKFIVIDGLIGSGKTTLIRECLLPQLKKLGYRACEIKEPVEKWKETGSLEQFYKDPARRAFQFQVMAFHDRVKECQQVYNENKDNIDIFILERSIFTDILFMQTLADSGLMDNSECNDYNNLWKMWTNVMPFKPTMFVYLKPSIDTCMIRLHERNRKAESGVSADYQQKLQEKHDKFFLPNEIIISENIKVPRIILETNDNFKTDLQVQESITNLIIRNF
jgi:deoxyadenosine/deoxycytidine kinase